MKVVRFHPSANLELITAIDWYLARSESAAARFVHEIEHAVERIAAAPERYSLTRFSRRRFVLLNFPFDLV